MIPRSLSRASPSPIPRRFAQPWRGATAAIRRRPAPGWPSGCRRYSPSTAIISIFPATVTWSVRARSTADNPAPGSDILLIDDQGDFHIVEAATSEKLAAFEGTVINSFSFGPALVVDGEVVEDGFLDDVAYDKPAQRMVVAQAGPLSYVCVATEGPENPGSVGLTIPQMAEFMGTLDVQNAYNLDGGSSSTMVLNNEKINALSTHKVRSICDILYFATLVNQE